MKQLNFVFALILLIGNLSCDKEKNDIVFKLKNGLYMGSFSYDNNHLWESFIIQNDSFVELASGGVLFQKFPELCLTKGTYEIINDSIYFINVQVAQPPNGNIEDYDKEYLLMGSYYLEEYSDSTVVFSRIAKKSMQEYDLKLYYE